MPPEFEPYVGFRSFEEHDQRIFFGRKREVSDLLSLVIAHPVVLLYAQSGAGKTSLLNAGLIPCLRQEGLEVLPVARVQGLIPKGIQLETVSNPYVFNSLMSWSGERESARDPLELTQMSLESFLGERPRPKDEDGNLLPRVLIFDQFEELFSSYPERWVDRRDFLAQIGKLLAGDSSLRVLFAMREDYIAQLDPYVSLLPENLRARLRLECLRRHAAQDAIEGPLSVSAKLAGSPEEDAKAIAEKLVDRLLMNRIETAPGKIEEVQGEFVEPVQLQVVCQRLWQKYRDSGLREIPETLPDVDEALLDYYEESIASVAGMSGVPEEKLRDWFGEKLITKLGTRGVVFREPEQTAGIPNYAVDVLSDRRHIIRGEWRAGARWYELGHDRFIEPIRRSNDAWRKRQQADNPLVQAELWQRRDRDSSVLLRGKRLSEAEAWEKAHPRLVDDPQREFLQASLKREKAEMQRQVRDARTMRVLTIALGLLFLLAVAFGVMAFLQRNQARDAEKEKGELVVNLYVEQVTTYVYVVKDYDKALEKLAEALGRDPTRDSSNDVIRLKREIAAGLLERGRKYARNLEDDRALADLKRARELDDTLEFVPEAEVAKELGRAYARQSKKEEAFAQFDEANELDPLLKLELAAEFTLQQGGESARLGRMDEAAESLIEALNLDPRLSKELTSTLQLPPKVDDTLAGKLVDRGRDLAHQGQIDTAKATFGWAVELNPRLQLVPELEVVLAQGRGYAQAGRIDEAVAAIQSAREISPTLRLAEPELSRALKTRAFTAFSKKDDYTKVLLSLRQAVEFDPASGAEIARLCEDFGRQYAQQGQTDAALAAFRLANELDPNLKLVPEDEVARFQVEQK